MYRALECTHGNFLGIETPHTHRPSEFLYICQHGHWARKAACRLHLAYTYRVPLNAAARWAPSSPHLVKNVLRNSAWRRRKNTGGFCVLPAGSLPSADWRKRKPRQGSRLWRSFLRQGAFCQMCDSLWLGDST